MHPRRARRQQGWGRREQRAPRRRGGRRRVRGGPSVHPQSDLGRLPPLPPPLRAARALSRDAEPRLRGGLGPSDPPEPSEEPRGEGLGPGRAAAAGLARPPARSLASAAGPSGAPWNRRRGGSRQALSSPARVPLQPRTSAPASGLAGAESARARTPCPSPRRSSSRPVRRPLTP